MPLQAETIVENITVNIEIEKSWNLNHYLLKRAI